MSFLFSRSKAKTPAELVRALRDLLKATEVDKPKNQEEISRLLYQIKFVLHGDQYADPLPDQIAQLAHEVYTTEVLLPLVSALPSLEFDARKDAVVLFTTLLRRQIGHRSPTIDYLLTRPAIFEQLIIANGNIDAAHNCGAILRDCIKYEPLTKCILGLPEFWNLFDYVTDAPFEMAADAFVTLNDLLCAHPAVAAEFLATQSPRFVAAMSGLMSSDNYVTKRQSLRLMSHIVTQRSNYAFMTEYISSVDNLKLVMILLRDHSRNIQYDAFHIFKVFVANPKKPRVILDILIKNKTKLEKFLSTFQTDRSSKEDPAFHDERAFILSQIAALPDSHSSPTSSVPSTAASSAAPSRRTSPVLSPTTATLPPLPPSHALPAPPLLHPQQIHRQQQPFRPNRREGSE